MIYMNYRAIIAAQHIFLFFSSLKAGQQPGFRHMVELPKYLIIV